MPDVIDNKGGTVEIPGAPTMRKTHGLPPTVVELPLIASPAVKLIMSVCAFGVVACLFVPVGAVVLASKQQDHDNRWLGIGLAIMFSLFAIYSFAKLVSFIADARRPRPTIRIDGEGFRDERSRSSIAWRDVEWLAFYRRDRVLMAAFGLRRPRPASRRFLLPEALVKSTPANEAHILLEHLDKPAGTIAEVMKALVRQHGGRVDDVYKSNGRLRF